MPFHTKEYERVLYHVIVAEKECMLKLYARSLCEPWYFDLEPVTFSCTSFLMVLFTPHATVFFWLSRHILRCIEVTACNFSELSYPHLFDLEKWLY